MGRVFFRGWQLRAAVLLLFVCVAAFFAGGVNAATPSSGTVSASSPTATFTGGPLTAPNFLPDCPSQTADPGNTVCEHYTLTVVGSGTVQACVQFTDDVMHLNDVDVFVYQVDPVTGTQTQIAAGITANNPECVSFPNTLANGLYEIRINPSFISPYSCPDATVTRPCALLMPPELAQIIISGTVTFTPTPTPPGGSGNTLPPGTKMTGGGKTTDAGQFNLNLFASDWSKGKVKFAQTAAGCAFRSSQMTSEIFTTTADGGNVDFSGQGMNNNQPVTFQGHAEDHGQPSTADVFQITATDANGVVVCKGGGFVSDGNVKYHT